MKAVTAAEMRQIEDAAIRQGTSLDTLMQKAGRSVADSVVQALGGRVAQRCVLVLAGPGRNGGDGLIAARLLAQRGASVTVACPLPRGENDSLLVECAAAGCKILPDLANENAMALASAEIVVDGILGTGRSRAIEGRAGEVLRAVAEARARPARPIILAVDVPSGLDPDTGIADTSTVAADISIALGSVKQGCLTASGAENCGQIQVASIGLESVGSESGIEILDCQTIAEMLPVRPVTGHKGTFGHAVIIGGAEAYRGAPALAAKAAARAGAGTVAIASPERVTDSVAAITPEATHIPIRQWDEGGADERSGVSQLLEALKDRSADAVLIGPGIGLFAMAAELLRSVMAQAPPDVPIALDADALTMLARMPNWWERLKVPAVLTPHPGEMARLCGISVEDVQAARPEIAARKATEWGATVVLKGAYTVVANPNEEPSICPLAFPALASGGTGDTLAGIITGFLAQGLPPCKAAYTGVYVHGVAGILAARANGNLTLGLLASDLIDSIPAALGLIRRGGPPPFPLFA